MRPVFALVLLLLVALGQAQTVRDSDDNPGPMRRSGERQADNAGFSGFPRLMDGDVGTQVHLSGNYRNADATLLMSPPPSRVEMVNIGTSIAKSLGLPKTDFILTWREEYAALDLEFNDYIQRNGMDRRFELDLGRLRTALEANRKIPRPIVLRIYERSGAESSVQFPGATAKRIPAKESVFYRLEDIPAGARFTMQSTRAPWAPFLAVVMRVGELALAVILFFAFGGFIHRPKLAPRQPSSPEEVQALYDARPQMRNAHWVFAGAMMLFSSILVGMPFASPSISAALSEVEKLEWTPLLPGVSSPMMVLIPALLGLMVSGLRHLRMRKTPLPSDGEKTQPAKGDWVSFDLFKGPQRPLAGTVIGFFVGFVLALLTIPFFAKEIRIVAVPALISGGPLLGWLCGILFAPRLPKDHPLYQRTLAIARRKGVRLSRVEIYESKDLNAYAGLLGNVGVTSALLEQLEPEEVDAVIAHEIGHVRHRHVLRMAGVTVLVLAGFYGLTFWMEFHGPTAQIRKWGDALSSFPFGVLWITVGVFFTAGRSRKNEFAADAFALDCVRDPEILIAALTKITDHSKRPHRLHPEDEKYSTHPSLENRVTAIRARWAETGGVS